MPSNGDLEFGRLAIEFGYTTKLRVEECLREQVHLEKDGLRTSVDRVLLRKGYLIPLQVSEIQRKQGRKIIFCTSCYTKLNVAGFKPGQKVRCPACEDPVEVPSLVKPDQPVPRSQKPAPEKAQAAAKPPAAQGPSTREITRRKEPKAPSKEKLELEEGPTGIPAAPRGDSSSGTSRERTTRFNRHSRFRR